jgi:P4 family phage/plasmid primase-like protien
MAMPSKQSDGFNPFSVALMYRKAGWLGTIPIPYNEKHPPPKHFTGAAASYPDDAKVNEWLAGGRSNIALRLAETDHLPKASPYQTNKYELLGIDVDDYGDKAGYEQFQALEEKYGKLPATVCSSSRWEQSPNSGIRLYLVPAGLHFLGKAAPAIEVIQRAHRYMLVWPSINPDVPDAEVSTYRFKDPDGAYYEHREEASALGALAAAIPPLADVSVFPEGWLDFLTCNRLRATGNDISSLGGDELLTWAAESFNDSQGEMCRMMGNAVEKKLSDLENCTAHHDLMITTHWHLLRLGAEGHSGWIEAMKSFNNKWFHKTQKDRGGEAADVLAAEIQRSVIGSLSKIEPELDGYIPNDECGSGNVTALHDVDGFHVNISEDDPEVDNDFDSLGPLISQMPKSPTNSGDYQHSDDGNAKHFIDIFGENIKYVETAQNWVLWDGISWNRSGVALINRAFSIVAKRQQSYSKNLPRGSKEQIQKANSWHRWSLRSGNTPAINNAIKQIESSHHKGISVATAGNQFDRNPKLLGCENGILVLEREPYLRPAKKEDFVTFNTHTQFIPWDTDSAEESGVLEGYKLWNEYLEIFLPDVKLRHFIQKVMGHLLIGGNPEKLLIFVYGPHDTGKSTMLGSIRSALGDYYGTVDINLFNNSKLNPGLIRAVPLRVAGMSEVDDGNMDANMIKRLTGNDTITAEAKFSNDIFEGEPQFTTVIALNQEPKIKSVDEALQERIIVLPFNFQIPMEKRDFARQTDIAAYSSEAVLAWLVDGWKMYCREGMKRNTWPLEVQGLCGNIVGNLNPTQKFITECIEKNTLAANEARQKAFEAAHHRKRTSPSVSDWDIEWTPTAAVVNELYYRWCTTNNERQISGSDLAKEIGCGPAQVRNVDGTSQRCYVGFRIREIQG